MIAFQQIQIADVTIAQALDEFLEDERGRLGPERFGRYLSVVEALARNFETAGPDRLDDDEQALLAHWRGDGQQLPFCLLFGPEMITGQLKLFFADLAGNRSAGPPVLRLAGTVSARLCRWLAGRGFVTGEDAAAAIALARDAARCLPRARAALHRLNDFIRIEAEPKEPPVDAEPPAFDRFAIALVKPGEVWLESLVDGGMTGPVPVGAPASSLLEEGWEIACRLRRTSTGWRIERLGGIFPV